MGIDFIRAGGGKTYHKRWAMGHQRASTPGLFDIRLGSDCRTATAMLASQAQPGAAVIIQRSGPDLIVFEGLRPLGRILNPPSDISACLEANHGMARGVVQSVGQLGQTAEIRFQ